MFSVYFFYICRIYETKLFLPYNKIRDKILKNNYKKRTMPMI